MSKQGYGVWCSNGRLRVEVGGSYQTVQEVKKACRGYVRAYSQNREQARWARDAINYLTKEEIEEGWGKDI
jgi:hypothetical protein